MENNKIILGYCPNFERVMHTDFLEDDVISLRLVSIYRDYIFRINIMNEDEINNIKELDQIMGKYVDDYYFRKVLQTEIKRMKVKQVAQDVIKTIVEAIIKIFKQYQEDQTRKIYISRWI